MEIYSENDVQSEERRATCTRGKFFAPFESFFFVLLAHSGFQITSAFTTKSSFSGAVRFSMLSRG